MDQATISERILKSNFSLEIVHSDENLNRDSPSDLESNDELTHYGILGMKWGIRRTPEQLGHATKIKKKDRKYEGETAKEYQARMQRESQERIAKTNAKQQKATEKAEAQKQIRQLKSQEKQQKLALKSQEKQRKEAREQAKAEKAEAAKKTSSTKVDTNKLSDQELRDAIARLQLENQYRQLSSKPKSKVAGFAQDVVTNAAKQIATQYVKTYASKGLDALIKKASNKEPEKVDLRDYGLPAPDDKKK